MLLWEVNHPVHLCDCTKSPFNFEHQFRIPGLHNPIADKSMTRGVVGDGGVYVPAISIIGCATGGCERDLCFSTGDHLASGSYVAQMLHNVLNSAKVGTEGFERIYQVKEPPVVNSRTPRRTLSTGSDT